MHLDHLERTYRFPNKQAGEGSKAYATVFESGWRLQITLQPEFWEQEDFFQQVRWLIHEHVHVALHPYHQACGTINDQWVAPHNSTQVQEVERQAAEIVVDHLTEVFYRLLEDRFDNL